MADLDLSWPADSTTNGDLSTDPTGDFGCVDGDPELRQRLTRRFLTNPRTATRDGSFLPPDDLFNITYGSGLRRMVGTAVNAANVAQTKQIVLDGVMQEDVAIDPPPDVLVQLIGGGMSVAASVTSATTARPVSTPRINLS